MRRKTTTLVFATIVALAAAPVAADGGWKILNVLWEMDEGGGSP